MVEGEGGWLDLSMLRWVSHPSLCAAFPGYLIGLYHGMHCAGAVMQAALERSRALASECVVASQLVAYWTQHIVDESGHDRWLLEDVQHVGLNAALVAATIPPPETAELLIREFTTSMEQLDTPAWLDNCTDRLLSGSLEAIQSPFTLR